MAKALYPLFPNGIGDLRYRQARNIKGFTHVAFIKNPLRKRKKKEVSKK